MSSLVTLMYMAIGAGCIIGSGYLGVKSKNTLEKLTAVHRSERIPISRSINKSNSKTISGIARVHEDTIQSQLQEETCLVYSSVIQDTSSIIKSNLFETKQMVPFVIEDGEDRVLVRDTDLSIMIEKDVIPIDNQTIRSIVSQETPTNTSLRSITAKEGYIGQDMSVFVHGVFNVRNDPDHTGAIDIGENNTAVISNRSKSDLIGYLTKKLLASSIGSILLLLAGAVIVWLGFELF